MYSAQLTVPAKGLLFGEYGVLLGYPAIAVTFFDPHFEIYFQLLDTPSKSEIIIESDFFASGFFSFSYDDIPVENFFYQLMLPWRNYLLQKKLKIEIKKSYPSSLGFGSSSALIAALNLFLFRYFFIENKNPNLNENILDNKNFWSFIRHSIQSVQGKGSGYDVAVQLYALQNSSVNFTVWEFQNINNNDIPKVKKLQIPNHLLSQYGCFLKTNIYSDTKKILAKHFTSNDKESFSQKNGLLAQQYLNDYSIDNLKNLMLDSQNLFPLFDDLSIYKEKLKGIPFKSMGAGFGDCLWVLCSKNELIERGFLASDIAFEFASIN
jgi:mevalonate kinase